MTVWQLSVRAMPVILAIVTVRTLALRRIPKRTFLVLWGLALFALLVPVRLHLPLPAPPLPFSEPEGWTAFNPSAAQNGAAVPGPGLAIGGGQNGPAVLDVEVTAIPWAKILWMAVAGGMAVCFAVNHIRCRLRYRFAVPCEDEAVGEWLRQNPLKGRRVKIKVSADISTALTYGVFRPVILLPKATDWEDRKSLAYVLFHEMTHIRHYDTVWKWCLCAALCVHWFNPLVWVMFILANRDLELICDESVLKAVGVSSKSEYALTLVALAEKQIKITQFGMAFSKNAIEERISAIMKPKKVSWLAAILAVALILGVTAGFAATGQVTDEAENLIEAHKSDAPKDAEIGPEGSGTVPGKAALWEELQAAGMPSKFLFCSGAGGWSTWLTVDSDGTFTGHFEDGEMGSGDPQNYPGGTAYVCDFAGVFSQPVQVDGYTLSVQVERLEIQPREETVEDGVRYLPAAPYGMENADGMLLLLPGKPVSQLSEDVLGWLHGPMDWQGDSLPFYALVNVNEGQAFCGWTVQS